MGFLQNLDRVKCRLLEGTNAQDVRALVLDMQARLLLDMLSKGIESALVNPATLLPEPWQASGETLSSMDADKMIVEQALVPSIQVKSTTTFFNLCIDFLGLWFWWFCFHVFYFLLVSC